RFELSTVDVSLSEAAPDADSQLDNAKADGAQNVVTLGFSVDNFMVYQDNDITIELTHGSLSFTPTIDLDLTLSGASLSHFLAAGSGHLDGAVELNITAPNGGTWN